MTHILRACWQIAPLRPPRPWRHCPGCGGLRPFVSSGLARANANGRRIDAWLIYRCAHCERSWNRPLIERRPVGEIPAETLAALQGGAPATIRDWEHDLTALSRLCDRIEVAQEVEIRKPPPDPDPDPDAEARFADWTRLELTLKATRPTGLRLDRLLAAELPLSRAALQRMRDAGGARLSPDGKSALRRPLQGEAQVRIDAAGLPKGRGQALGAALARALFA